MKNLYSIQKYENTNEWHIFVSNKGEKKDDCLLSKQSICKKMKYTDTHIPENDKSELLCLSEEAVRHLAAKLGRKVCGICVSNLYGTFN